LLFAFLQSIFSDRPVCRASCLVSRAPRRSCAFSVANTGADTSENPDVHITAAAIAQDQSFRLFIVVSY
jgi:hypothetical protein